ncbi:MAG: GntR family transcriptional regulator [Anaerolineae bacterium]|nr:GntR family transcriptional regulator [Anaerolineae bacterium]
MSNLPLKLDGANADPIYRQLAHQLRQFIASGELSPGAALPTVRDVAETLGCSVGAVARAYAVLQQEGLLTTRRGGGTHVAESAQPGQTWLREASLVNALERPLLDALAQGYSPSEIEAAFGLALARWRTLMSATETTTSSPSPAALRFTGSHDLSLEALFRLVRRPPASLSVSTAFVGSLSGLMALAEGRADLAGVHLVDEDGEYNAPFVRRLLPGQRAVLVRLATRLVGWIVPPGNPRGVRNWDDLGRPGLRLVNRQRGSGTRVLLDRHVARLGLTPDRLTGYDRVAETHLALAQAVAQGEADAGLGIYAAARACGLDFAPLAEEPYDLVVLAQCNATPSLQTVLATLRGDEFQRIVEALGGYRVEGAGQEVWVEG